MSMVGSIDAAGRLRGAERIDLAIQEPISIRGQRRSPLDLLPLDLLPVPASSPLSACPRIEIGSMSDIQKW